MPKLPKEEKMRVAYFSDANFDFPKKINDLRVAWYNQGKNLYYLELQEAKVTGTELSNYQDQFNCKRSVSRIKYFI